MRADWFHRGWGLLRARHVRGWDPAVSRLARYKSVGGDAKDVRNCNEVFGAPGGPSSDALTDVGPGNSEDFAQASACDASHKRVLVECQAERLVEGEPRAGVRSTFASHGTNVTYIFNRSIDESALPVGVLRGLEAVALLPGVTYSTRRSGEDLPACSGIVLVLGDVFAEKSAGLVEVLGCDVARAGVGDVISPPEQGGLVLFLDAGAGGLGEVLGWDPCPGAGADGAVVGGVEELAGGPWAAGAAGQAKGVQEGAVVLAEESGGPQGAGVRAGAYGVGVGPVGGAEQGSQEGPRLGSFCGQEAVESVGASGDVEGEAVEHAAPAGFAGVCEGFGELGQVGHGRVLSGLERGRRSAAASLGPGRPVPGPCGRGAVVDAVSRPGGRRPWQTSSHPPIVPVTCDTNRGVLL